MAQSSFVGLIIHLTVAIERIQKKEYIEVDSSLFSSLKDDILYVKAKKIVRDVELSFGISP